MNEKDIREYSRTLLDAFNDLTGNSINPNLDDFLKIRERSIFELNSFCKNNQKKNEKNEKNEIVDDNKIVNVHSNQKTNVDESVNEIDDFKENKELSSTSTLKVKKQENVKSEDKPTLIQNKKQNVDNKQQKNDNKINQESKNVVKNETSNSNVIADETDETDNFVFRNDEDNFNMNESKTAFDILKGIEDPWN
jgi:hypothetical protein